MTSTHFTRLSYFLVIAFLLQACALFTPPNPQTLNERLAVMEISYQEVLSTATLYANEGRLDASQAEKIDSLFDNYEKYRNAARAALTISDLATAEAEASKISKALIDLRLILTEAAQ